MLDLRRWSLALVVGVLVRTGPPFGAVAVAMGIADALIAAQSEPGGSCPPSSSPASSSTLARAPGARERRRQAAAGAGAAVGLVARSRSTVAVTSVDRLVTDAARGRRRVAAAIGGWGVGALLERHAPLPSDDATRCRRPAP